MGRQLIRANVDEKWVNEQYEKNRRLVAHLALKEIKERGDKVLVENADDFVQVCLIRLWSILKRGVWNPDQRGSKSYLGLVVKSSARDYVNWAKRSIVYKCYEPNALDPSSREFKFSSENLIQTDKMEVNEVDQNSDLIDLIRQEVHKRLPELMSRSVESVKETLNYIDDIIENRQTRYERTKDQKEKSKIYERVKSAKPYVRMIIIQLLSRLAKNGDISAEEFLDKICGIKPSHSRPRSEGRESQHLQD